ncbi:MAG: glutathione S-transferase family protein [Pseudomonadota bacterium]
MSMLLYHCRGSRSFRPLWCLEEMGLIYTLKVLPFPPRVREAGYKQVNPLGTVPYLVDGEARLSESTAICHYLTATYGPTDLALDPGDPGYGAFLNWLYFSDATLTFPQILVLRYKVLEKERGLEAPAEDYAKWFAGRLRHVEAALEDRAFLVADRFTIADIAIGYALKLASGLPVLQDMLTPNCAAYLARLRKRPAYQRADAA